MALRKIIVLVTVLLMIFCFGAVGCAAPAAPDENPGAQPGEPKPEPIVPVVPDPDDYEGSIPPIEGRTLTFSDEFAGDTLDETKWECQTGTGLTYGLDGWGNGEQQYYKKENATVQDGSLVIALKSEPTRHENGRDTLYYTSARLRTKGKFSQTYGRFEARIRVDAVSGLWPAFWLLPEEDAYGGWPRSGELDIMELRGRLAYEASCALHYATEGGGHDYASQRADIPHGGRIDEWHVYAAEWTEDSIVYYIDGAEFYRVSAWTTPGKPFPAPYDRDFHILLNLAAGGHFDGYRNPPERLLPAEMRVDYVRVYAPET